MLLVVVDQPGIRRRRDDPGGLEWEIDFARILMHDNDFGAATNEREGP